MSVSKNKFPHLFQFESFGGYDYTTEEGFEYLDKYKIEIEKEKSRLINENLHRFMKFGGNKKIHCPNPL